MPQQTGSHQLFKDTQMTADRYSQWVRADLADLNIHLFWTGSGSPVGAFKVELSNDPIIMAEKDRIVNGAASGNGGPSVSGASSAAKKVDITASITPVYGTGLTVTGGADGSTMFALTAGQARWFRIFFDHSSGGTSASLLQGEAHGV